MEALQGTISNSIDTSIFSGLSPFRHFNDQLVRLGLLPRALKREEKHVIQKRTRRNHCGFCPITGVSSPAFLRASHIKPWRACETADERLDPYNGLALAPHIDQLFDQGYKTFDGNGTLIISDECPPMIPMQWGFEDKIGEISIDVSPKRRKYIGYHNRYIFKR